MASSLHAYLHLCWYWDNVRGWMISSYQKCGELQVKFRSRTSPKILACIYLHFLIWSWVGYYLLYKILYWVISYVCVPRFCFRSKSLIFMTNPGHYLLKSPCYSQNGPIFTPKYLSGYLPMISVPSVRCGVWGVLWEIRGRGGFEWVGLRWCARNYFVARIFCTKPNP